MKVMLLICLVIGALFLLFLYISIQKSRRLTIQIEQALEEDNRSRVLALEADLQDWLQTLQLPALADQTKLAAAARQLRKVLVERLMNGPRYD